MPFLDDASTISTEASPNAEPTGVGLSNPQMSLNRRKMLDLVNRLHSTGVQVDIDLPQIAVIGSQSAGKSSLIESISGITLPRAAGTCTRCPTECRLTFSESTWKCDVSLRFTTDAKGKPLGQARNEVFGPTIYRKAELEDRIRRAQRAILNPSKPVKEFLENDGEVAETELSFSTNCVSLQISGPDVADLSFCDLPGLIASVGRDRDENDINLVKNLVSSYIRKPSCIILLTVACETDFENQGAHQLARQWDSGGKRTIGVLTKPDRIPDGDESGWIAFIKNDKETLENNWYCVKQPSSSDLKEKWSWEMARQSEERFFASSRPWRELEGMYQKFLGTSNLVTRLSSILSDLITKRLPGIREEIEKAIFKTRDQLAELPREASKQPLNEVSSLLHNFVADVTRQVTGIPDEAGLLQLIRPAQEQFRREIRLSLPKFKPYEKNRKESTVDSSDESEDGEVFSDEHDDDGDEDDASSNEKRAASDDEGRDEAREEAAAAISSPPVSLFGKRKRGSKVIYVDEVFVTAKRYCTRELPGSFPFVVRQKYINTCVKQWRYPAVALCKAVYRTVSDYLNEMVHRHFSDFGRGNLHDLVRFIIHEHIKSCFSATEGKINWLVDLEEQPFSLNHHYFQDYQSRYLTYYRASRYMHKHPAVMEKINSHKPSSHPLASKSGDAAQVIPPVTKALVGITEMGISSVKARDLAKLLPTDKMSPALEVMADVRAYCQVAYKRFTDTVPMAIDRELVLGIEKDIISLLRDGLGLNSLKAQSICVDFAREKPAVANRREELNKKLQRLEEASQQLLRCSGID